MLIFVQVCRTIDKNLVCLNSSIGSKEQMTAMDQQKGSLKRLKKRGSEDKRFWRSWRHQKHSTRKLFTRSWRHQRFWRSSEAGRLEASKVVQMLLSRLSLQKNISLKQRLIQRNWNALDAYSLDNVGKDNTTSVQPLFPLLWFVSVIVQEQQLWLRWLFLYTWNGFEIVPS